MKSYGEDLQPKKENSWMQDLRELEVKIQMWHIKLGKADKRREIPAVRPYTGRKFR